MPQKKLRSINVLFLLMVVFYFISCSKKDATPTPPPPVDPCAGKVITVTATSTAAAPCGGNNGTVTVTATGSTGFTYKLNSTGAYQPSGVFHDVSAATYTVFAKDAAGCENSNSVTVAASGTAGALFTAVKSLIIDKCKSCHNASNANGGVSYDVDCNIVSKASRINQRAVVEGTMPLGGPQLTQAEKDIITNWINAGAKFTD